MENTTLSTLLENRRKNLLLTQDQFAKMLGITQQAYGKWKSGVSTPRQKHMKVVAEVLQISVEEAIQAKVSQQHLIQLGQTEKISKIENAEPKEINKMKNISTYDKSETLTGYGLLLMITSELEKGTLQQHHINTLGSLVHSFTLQQ